MVILVDNVHIPAKDVVKVQNFVWDVTVDINLLLGINNAKEIVLMDKLMIIMVYVIIASVTAKNVLGRNITNVHFVWMDSNLLIIYYAYIYSPY